MRLVHHEARKWLILTDCSNAFNTVKRTAVLADAATCVPALTPFIAKCCGEGLPLYSFKRIQGSGERSNVRAEYSKGTPWARRCSACRCYQC